MKTIFQPRRGNNVQKTFLRTAAVIVSFVLLSLTVTAQGYWKQLFTNGSFNQLASALVEGRSLKTTGESSPAPIINTTYFYDEPEPVSNLLPWMSDSYYFFNPCKVIEAGLELEGWMLLDNYFGNYEVLEKPLELKDWMLR